MWNFKCIEDSTADCDVTAGNKVVFYGLITEAVKIVAVVAF